MGFLDNVNSKGGDLNSIQKRTQSPSPPIPQPKVTGNTRATNMIGGEQMTTRTEPITSSTSSKLPFTVWEENDFELPETKLNNTIQRVRFVTDIDYLLKFVARIEKQTLLTLPLEAYGFSEGLFDSLDEIVIEDSEYELVECSGKKYLSCCSKILNEEFFDSIIKEATLSIMEFNKYVFPLIAPRIFIDNDQSSKIITTMQLNTYELNALIKYMNSFGATALSIEDSKSGLSKIEFKRNS